MRYLTHLNLHGRAQEDRPGTLVGALPSRAGRHVWDDVLLFHGRTRRRDASGAASPPTVDRLATFRPFCGGVAAPADHPELRGSGAATTTKESPMPPTDPGRFTNHAAATHPAEPFIPLQLGEGHVRAQGDHAREGPAATGPRPSRSLTSAAARPVRNFRPRPFDDPCNYLG